MNQHRSAWSNALRLQLYWRWCPIENRLLYMMLDCVVVNLFSKEETFLYYFRFLRLSLSSMTALISKKVSLYLLNIQSHLFSINASTVNALRKYCSMKAKIKKLSSFSRKHPKNLLFCRKEQPSTETAKQNHQLTEKLEMFLKMSRAQDVLNCHLVLFIK